MEKLLTIKETAEILGLAEGTIRNRIKKTASKPFELKPVRIGRAVRFKKSDIEKLVGDDNGKR